MIKFYGYKKCGSCRKAERFLQTHKLNYQFIDITLSPPSAEELNNVLKYSDLELRKWFNTSGVMYRELDMKTKLPLMSTSQAIDLLSQNGKLIKRPLIMQGKKVTIGYNEDELKQTWKAT